MATPRTASSQGQLRASSGSGDALLTPGRGLGEFARQAALVACAVLLYFAVRGLTEGSEPRAITNGRNILEFEERLGVAIEQSVQAYVADSHVLATLSNWVYIWLHWPVIIATLLWLHRRHRFDYLLLRNAMFISGAVGLVVFALYPVAPPRLLDDGFVDTVTELSTSYRILQPPALVNEFAAMPSLHVGWNLLVGIALWRTSRHPSVRAIAILGPTLMAVAVVTTANHYVVDGIAGSVVALTGLAGAHVITLPLAVRFDRSHKRQIVDDDAVDPSLPQPVDGDHVVHGPGEERSPGSEPLDHPVGQQPAVHDRPVDPRASRHPREREELETVAGRAKGADPLTVDEPVEDPPCLR
jgi:membrane-associated phospholipid phosphatase